MTFSKRYRYRFGDIDDAGIAYYPSYFHYFHCCFEDWWSDALGTPYPQVLHEEEFGLPAVRIETDFRSPLRYGDEPIIHLAVLRIGTTSVEFGYWMTLEGRERATCRARITTVSMDMGARRKQPVPAKWRAAFARYAIDENAFLAL
jgi:4-hydroxybenzoyl-CoA thioesterase